MSCQVSTVLSPHASPTPSQQGSSIPNHVSCTPPAGRSGFTHATLNDVPDSPSTAPMPAAWQKVYPALHVTLPHSTTDQHHPHQRPHQSPVEGRHCRLLLRARKQSARRQTWPTAYAGAAPSARGPTPHCLAVTEALRTALHATLVCRQASAAAVGQALAGSPRLCALAGYRAGGVAGLLADHAGLGAGLLAGCLAGLGAGALPGCVAGSGLGSLAGRHAGARGTPPGRASACNEPAGAAAAAGSGDGRGDADMRPGWRTCGPDGGANAAVCRAAGVRDATAELGDRLEAGAGVGDTPPPWPSALSTAAAAMPAPWLPDPEGRPACKPLPPMPPPCMRTAPPGGAFPATEANAVRSAGGGGSAILMAARDDRRTPDGRSLDSTCTSMGAACMQVLRGRGVEDWGNSSISHGRTSPRRSSKQTNGTSMPPQQTLAEEWAATGSGGVDALYAWHSEIHPDVRVDGHTSVESTADAASLPPYNKRAHKCGTHGRHGLPAAGVLVPALRPALLEQGPSPRAPPGTFQPAGTRGVALGHPWRCAWAAWHTIARRVGARLSDTPLVQLQQTTQPVWAPMCAWLYPIWDTAVANLSLGGNQHQPALRQQQGCLVRAAAW
eukprot:364905-Chlamydomonas_euryale.AAC.1